MTERRGVVLRFDEHAGHGLVRDAESEAEHFFHCTSIADGSRTIPVGSEVSFAVAAGHNGKWEAVDVRRIY